MTDTAPPSRMPVIGYLTNVYPAVSHSFIKREILALEEMGVTVHRWSIRPCAPHLPDSADRREAERTDVLLASLAGVVLAALGTLARHPRRAIGVLRASLAGRPAGLRSAIVRIAHFAEACHLVRAARSKGVEHIHAHFGTNPAAVARLCHLLGGPTYSFTAHGPDEFDQPMVHGLHAKIADARFAIAISHYGRSQLMRWSDLADWPKIHVVPCGLDDVFLAGPVPPIEDDGPPTCVCVARLAPQKGLPVLLQAATLLRRRGCAFRIVIAGEGDLRSQLEKTIAAEDLGDCVALLGAISADAVRAQILAARAFVLPSFAEGLPVSIMEALAQERPVITTRIAGIPELVDDQCGVVVDAGDAAGLADAIERTLGLPAEVLREQGRIGRSRVLARHDARTSAALLFNLLAGEQRAC